MKFDTMINETLRYVNVLSLKLLNLSKTMSKKKMFRLSRLKSHWTIAVPKEYVVIVFFTFDPEWLRLFSIFKFTPGRNLFEFWTFPEVYRTFFKSKRPRLSCVSTGNTGVCTLPDITSAYFNATQTCRWRIVRACTH